MKILVVTTKSPYPLYEGRALRTYNLIKQVARAHEVYLYSFVQTQEEVLGVEHMREFCACVEVEPLYLGGGRWRLVWDLLRDLVSRSPLLAVKYRTATMRRRIRALLKTNAIDVVHLDMLHLADYLDDCGDRPVVLVEHNVESVLMRRRIENESSWLRKFYLFYQYHKLKRYEARVCARAQHVVSVSELDRQLISELSGNRNVTSISNGVDTDYFRNPGLSQRPNNLVFVGGLTWFPNHDGICYFVDEILPRIVKEVPDVTLTVVGKNPDNKSALKLAANPRLHFTGLVDDVRPYMSQAAAYVVPLRIGGGTRLKILDALSMEKPIVSTSVGCEGLDVGSGEHLLIADTPEKFAAEIVRVLRDTALAARLGRAGREMVQRKYDWHVIAQDLERVYQTVLSPRASALN